MPFKFSKLIPQRKKDVDMTEGNITRHIIMFAFPLLIGNVFQQLYNPGVNCVIQLTPGLSAIMSATKHSPP